jgi:hypothetical protein
MELTNKYEVIAFTEGLCAAFGNNPVVNLSSKASIRNSYLKFKNSVITNNLVSKTCDRLKKEVTSPEAFYSLMSDESFTDKLKEDYRGKKLKVVFSKEVAAHRALRKEFYGKYTFNESEIVDPDNAFVIRNADGNADPMFVEGGEEFISKCAHELATLYHYETNTKYYDARPIKYSTWLANPETQLQTRFRESIKDI